ncbi:Bug family tripartite tricarboxylate transporter substrate binding protein [Bordetella sp. 2513F-2]
MPTLLRRAAGAFAFAFTTLLPFAVQAQGKPVKLVVGAPPGGTTDIVARAIGQSMSDTLKRTVLVENRPGAGGNIAADYVAKQKDDDTLLVSFTSFSINASLYPSLPFDPMQDFTPISMLAKVPSVLVVRKDFPAADMAQLVAEVKAHPGKYTIGIGALGSSLHMAGESMKMLSGMDILNVPYKGTAPAMSDLLGGQVDMMFASVVTALPQVKAGAVRIMGVTSTGRLAPFPDVPPIGDTIKGFESTAWFALFGPAGMAPAKLAELNAAARKAVATEAFRKLMETDAATPVSSSPEELDSFVREDIARYADVIRHTGATVN